MYKHTPNEVEDPLPYGACECTLVFYFLSYIYSSVKMWLDNVDNKDVILSVIFESNYEFLLWGE